jgi:glycosyltransferase involved in cell wall biosynthesis
MKVYFENTAFGSLNDINSDIKNYFSDYVDVEDELYRGSDVSISNFIQGIHSNDYFFKKNTHNVLIQPMDGTIIQRHVVDTINKFDLIITPSSIGKKLLKENGVVKQIEVVPNYFKNITLPPRNTNDKIIFYHESSLIDRKNFKGLYESFLYAFSDSPYYNKVKLIIKTNGGSIEGLEVAKRRYKNIPEIEIYNDYIAESELIRLWVNVDIYVSFSHMEGFGIPLLNFAAMGKPIVTLNSSISGYIDFLNDENCYLVDSKKFSTSKISLIFSAGSTWEDIDNLENAKKVLRKSVLDFKNRCSKTVKPESITSFSFDEVMCKYLELIYGLVGEEIPQLSKKNQATFYSRLNAKDSLLRIPLFYSYAGRDFFKTNLKTNEHFWSYFIDSPDMQNYTAKVVNDKLSDRIVCFDFTFNMNSLKLPPHVKKYRYSMYEADELAVEWVDLFKSEKLTKMIVPDDWVQGLYSKYFENVVVVPLGIYYSDVTVDLKKKKDKFVFGYMARLERRKNVTLMIDAFKRLFKNDGRFELKIHGGFDNDNKDEILRLIEGVENIKITTHIMIDSDVNNWWSQIDCYVIPSSGEGFSNTPREAIMRGIPAIVSNWSAHEKLVKLGVVRYFSPTGFEGAFKKTLFDRVVGNHATFDVKDVMKEMLYVYNNYEECHEQAMMGRSYLIENELWEICAKKLMNEIL